VGKWPLVPGRTLVYELSLSPGPITARQFEQGTLVWFALLSVPPISLPDALSNRPLFLKGLMRAGKGCA